MTLKARGVAQKAIGSEKSAASSSGPSGESPLAVDGPAAPPAGPEAPGADI